MLTSIPIISPIQVQLTAAHAADKIEQLVYVKEYHDPEWWRERLRIVKERLLQEP